MATEARVQDLVLSTPALPNEDALTSRARQGDNEAMALLVGRYRRLIFSLIQKVHGVPSADAEDVFQDVCQRFVRYRPRLERVRPLLASMAEHASLDYHRRRRAEQAAMSTFAAERQRGGAAYAARSEDAAIARLDARRILGVTRGRCLDLIARIVLCGTTHTEYAAETGTPRGTIGTTLARCLDKARHRLCALSTRRLPDAAA